MKTPRFLLAITLAAPFCGAFPIFAAPAKNPAPAKKPAIEPAAVALFDQSSAAYAKLNQFSQSFTIVDRKGAEETKLTGTFSLARPDKARLELSSAEGKLLTVSTGKEIVSQTGEQSFSKQTFEELGDDSPVEMVAYGIPGAAAGAFSDLIAGKNQLKTQAQVFASAKRSVVKGEDLIMVTTKTQGESPAATFQFYFDPKTHFLKRVQAQVTNEGVKYSNTTTFGALSSTVAPAQFAFALPAGATYDPPSYDASLVAGAKPFELAGTTLQGQPFSLENLKGKVVLLDFWATWCGPCVQEMPKVQALYKKYHDQGFEIVGVSLDKNESALRNFIKQRNMTWPQLFDGKGWESAYGQKYGVQAIPFTLLVGKDGNIAAANWRGKALEGAIQKALAQ